MKYKIEKTDSCQKLSLEDDITEDSRTEFKELCDTLKNEPNLIVDFTKIKSINSLGVKNWVLFLRALEEQKTNITLTGCPPAIISQLNMIPSFKGNATVRSLFVKYICPKCTHSEIIFLTLPEDFDLTLKKPKTKNYCPQDHSLLETEELEEEYFRFLEN